MAAPTPMFLSTFHSTIPPPNDAETHFESNAGAIAVVGPSGPHQNTTNTQKQKKNNKKKCLTCAFLNGNRAHKCKRCKAPFVIKNEGMKSNDIAKRKRWEESDAGCKSKKRRKTPKKKTNEQNPVIASPVLALEPQVGVSMEPTPIIDPKLIAPIKLTRQTAVMNPQAAGNESIGPPKLVRRSTLDILVDLLGPVDPEDTFDDNMTFDPSIFDDFGYVGPMQQNTFDLEEIEPFEF
jgi:hypothetical protein